MSAIKTREELKLTILIKLSIGKASELCHGVADTLEDKIEDEKIVDHEREGEIEHRAEETLLRG